MKKILIIGNKNPFENKGGVEFVVESIAERIKNDFNVYIICNGKEEKEYELNNIYIHQLKLNPLIAISDFEYAFRIYKQVKKIDPDLIIDNGCISFLNNPDKNKTISIAHGTNYGNYLSIKIDSLERLFAKSYRFFWAVIQRKYLKKCFRVVAVSYKVKTELVNFYKIDTKNIDVIDNGTYIKLSKEEKIKIINKKTNNNAIFVSTNHQWKGIKIVESIAKKLPMINFLICGSTYKPNMENIQYKGLLNQSNLKNQMIQCDFFIFPSQYEGQSLAILDALATGLPVIISKESDPGIIKDFENGFIIEDQNIEDYINKVKGLYSDFRVIKNIRENNINLMENYYWEKQAKKYLDLINSLL